MPRPPIPLLERLAGLARVAVFAAAAIGAAAVVAEEPEDAALQREMARLFALRTVDPPAFVAQMRTLESQAAPTALDQQEYLRFLTANRLILEGRAEDAIATALPLAESAASPGLRLRAGAFVVNVHGVARDAEAGLRRLTALLEAHPEARPGLEAEQRALWGTAATFHFELGQYGLSLAFAERVLGANPAPRDACFASAYRVMARQALRDPALDAAQFAAVDAQCSAVREYVPAALASLAHVRHLRAQGRLDEAMALLMDRLGAIDSTRVPRLLAEAYALDAELLQAARRPADARRQAQHAVALSAQAPTSLPAAMAEKVLYEIARSEGDAAAALHHLQRHLAASQALAEEDRLKARAVAAGRSEIQQRRQSLALLHERHRALALEADAARARSMSMALAAGSLALCALLLAGWGWRLMRAERRFRDRLQRDALTGFANRAHFARTAEDALARAERRGEPVALCTFDLDHFKRINDRHGHLAGDAVLRAVGIAVAAVPVPAGMQRRLGRIGGEEFALLLWPATAPQAQAHAEACRAAVAGAGATSGAGAALAVTASFGLTGSWHAGYRLDDLLAASDRSLYRAKSEGRDRVGPPLPGPAREAA